MELDRFFDDDITLIGTKNEYGEVLGGIEELNGWNKELSIVITIGSPHVISLIVEKLLTIKFCFLISLIRQLIFLMLLILGLVRGM